MMRIFVLAAIGLSGSLLYAQEEIRPSDYDVPVSPAFMLLDVSPTMVDRPVSSKAFTTSVLNSVSEDIGFPDDYGIEFTPMLLVPSKNVDHNSYYGIVKKEGKEKQNPFSQLRYFSFSAASINESLDSADQQKANNISLGLRFRLVQIQKKSAVSAYTAATQRYLARIADLRDANPLMPASDLIQLIASDAALKALEKPIVEAINFNPVFTVDLAGAVSYGALNSDFSTLSMARYAAWLTACYSNTLNSKQADHRDDFLNIYAFGRVLSDDGLYEDFATASNSQALDLGFKVEFELNRLSFSYELLQRRYANGGPANTVRSTGLLGYALSDHVSAQLVFGKNFGDQDNLISQVSLNYGLYGRSIGLQ